MGIIKSLTTENLAILLAYWTILVLAFIAVVEIACNYKGQLAAKIFVLCMAGSFITRSTAQILYITTHDFYQFYQLSILFCNVCLMLFLGIISNDKATKKSLSYFALALLALSIPFVAILLTKKVLTQHPATIYLLFVVRIAFTLVIGHFLYKHIKKFPANNVYLTSLRNWVFNCFIAVWLLVALLTIKLLFPGLSFFTTCCIGIVEFAMVLALIFRPQFLNNAIPEKIAGWAVFTDQNKKQVNEQKFGENFFLHTYYTKKQASPTDFSEIIGTSTEDLNLYVIQKYTLSFSDLLNKHRVIYFKQLIINGGYKQYTLEALADMAGFGSRQSMYNAFKKFEGCSPSDFVALVNT